jgi:hypothetical protein
MLRAISGVPAFQWRARASGSMRTASAPLFAMQLFAAELFAG